MSDAADSLRYVVDGIIFNELKEFLGMSLIKKFEIGKQVFDVVYGHGEVLNTEPEVVDDSYPVEVVFEKETDGEHVEFYDQDGKSMDNDRVTLFENQYKATQYVANVKKKSNYSRVFNFYDDGKCTTHADEISAVAEQTYEDCHISRKLVKRHKVEWSN